MGNWEQSGHNELAIALQVNFGSPRLKSLELDENDGKKHHPKKEVIVGSGTGLINNVDNQ